MTMWRIIAVLNFLFFSTSCFEVTPISAPQTNLSYSAVWDDCTQSVYYVDAFATGQQPSIFRYDFNEDKVYTSYIDESPAPSFFLPLEDCAEHKNQFVVGIGVNAKIIEWDGQSPTTKILTTLYSLHEDDPSSSLDLAHQSENGRLYGGTYHHSLCSAAIISSVYSFSKETGVKYLFSDAQGTTGLAFNSKAGKIYNTDSCGQRITAFADSDDVIGNRELIYDFKNLGPDKAPVGLDIDSDGNLYTALYGDGSIWRIDPNTSIGIPVARVPVPLVTAVVFGGPKKDILFTVAASAVLDPHSGQIKEYIPGISLYKITDLGATGRDYARLQI